jgi:phosphoribosylanthranilate isomerase
MRIKVCGMTRTDQLHRLEELGVTFAGLIFYPRSPRFVGKFSLTAADIKKEKLNINKVGVFVNATEEEVLRTVDEWRLQMVQLHGDETVKYCERISNHVNTIKAFRIAPDDNVPWKLNPYREVTDMFLFDSVGSGYGGTGLQFDWTLLGDARIGKPFFLSGGIGPEDTARLKVFSVRQPDLFSVDVNSRFEISPGVKDMKRVEEFCSIIRDI